MVKWGGGLNDGRVAGPESLRVHSNNLQALCDAARNTASLSRKYSCLESQAGALNQRSSGDAKARIIFSKNLNRRRKRPLARPTKIPDMSARSSRVRPRLQVERISPMLS